MLVNGKSVSGYHVDIIIELLAKLPSGFARRTAEVTKISYSLSGEAEAHNREAMAAYSEWKKNGKYTDIILSMNKFIEAANVSAHDGNPLAQANDLLNYGKVCLLANLSEQALPALEQALSIFEKEKKLDYVYKTVGILYSAITANIREKEHSGYNEEANELRKKLLPLRRRSVELFSHSSGQPINYDAYRVEQREIGFSDEQLIGTDNINSCVAVLIWDAKTHKMAIAHIDEDTDINSLQQVFNRMPKDNTLQVKIIGARSGDIKPFASSVESSNNNIVKVLRFLDGKNVNIISASILDPRQPTSVVVDPKTFEVFEESPGKLNPDSALANGIPLIGGSGRSLRVSIDLTSSVNREPIFLPHPAIYNLRKYYLGKTEGEIYKLITEGSSLSQAQIPTVVDQLLQISDGYKHSVENLIKVLDKRINDLADRGIEVSTFDRNLAADVISNRSIYIGSGAAMANQPLVDFINNNIFVFEKNGRYHLNLDGFLSLDLEAQPHAKAESRVVLPEKNLAR
ncbi:MAG: hypothetical protein JNK24_05770 [Alphaproteobacteria bacterium]|nr:hypothetical protein [Alphaproteobacteria bacterium]